MKSPATASADPRLPATGNALTALRSATRQRHNRIDRLMDLRRLADRQHYGRVLQVFDAFLEPWEAAVAAALPPATQAWLRDRSRRPFLRSDLRVLELQPLPCPAPVPPLHCAAAAWGSLYVMEGSALGGQAITRALAHAGLHPASGAAYFHGWGADTAGRWQDFRGRLEAELVEPGGIAAAREAACQTFDALTALLDSLQNERLARA